MVVRFICEGVVRDSSRVGARDILKGKRGEKEAFRGGRSHLQHESSSFLLFNLFDCSFEMGYDSFLFIFSMNME